MPPTLADIDNCYALLQFLQESFAGAIINRKEMDSLIRSLSVVLSHVVSIGPGVAELETGGKIASETLDGIGQDFIQGLKKELAALKQDIAAILDSVPEACRVIVREGGAEENPTASLAVSVSTTPYLKTNPRTLSTSPKMSPPPPASYLSCLPRCAKWRCRNETVTSTAKRGRNNATAT